MVISGGNFWLRSPGDKPGNAADVNANGNVNADGNKVGDDDIGVRPDLQKIKIGSDVKPLSLH